MKNEGHRGISKEELAFTSSLHDAQVGKPGNWMMISGVDDNGTFFVNHGAVTPQRITLFNQLQEQYETGLEMREDGLYGEVPISDAGIPVKVRIAPPDDLYKEYIKKNASSVPEES